MNAIWSYEGNPNFNKAEIASAKASVTLWKRLYPEHTTYLVCDKNTIKYFAEVGLINLYDKVLILQQNDIDKNVFWATCKIQAISQIQAPLCHIDLDFFTWHKFEDFGLFDERMAAAFKEETSYYYLDTNTATKGTDINLYFNGIAYNTSFMYFGDEDIKNEYCNTALRYMHQASLTYDNAVFENDKSLYMIFAEQQLFGEIAYKNNINVKTILKEKYIAGHSVFESDLFNNGILKECFAENYLVHLGEFKKEMKNDINLQNNVCNHVNYLINE